jgi:hypothetical protein
VPLLRPRANKNVSEGDRRCRPRTFAGGVFAVLGRICDKEGEGDFYLHVSGARRRRGNSYVVEDLSSRTVMIVVVTVGAGRGDVT